MLRLYGVWEVGGGVRIYLKGERSFEVFVDLVGDDI